MGAVSDRTTLYLRGMPKQLVREAKAVAARRGVTLASVVAEALGRSLDASAGPGGDGDDLGASMAWYQRHRARLLRRYRGQYVAIVSDKLVDHDRDFSELAGRVFDRIGLRPVYMPKVGEEPTGVRVRSPRVTG